MATARPYGRLGLSLWNKELGASDTFKLMLVSNLYVPDYDAHRYKSDITNEITGTGYTAGGAVIGSTSTYYDAATHRSWLDGNDVTWPTSTITAYGGVVYCSTPATDATRPLVGFVDFGGPVSSTTATFSVPWDPSGICYIDWF